jgi:segregation and condensation protein B
MEQMKMEEIYLSVIEALIFSSEEPLKEADILKAIKGIDGDDIEISAESINEAVDALNERYEERGDAFQILKIAEGFLFGTRPEYAKYLGYLASEKSKRRLSQAALETLAIIAYKQPITKPEIENIRGVGSDYIVGTLLDRKLVTIGGRSDAVGRPLLYITTDEFLKYFGLNALSDLPKPREIDEIMQDDDFIEQKRKIMMNALEQQMENETSSSSNDDDNKQDSEGEGSDENEEQYVDEDEIDADEELYDGDDQVNEEGYTDNDEAEVEKEEYDDEKEE